MARNVKGKVNPDFVFFVSITKFMIIKMRKEIRVEKAYISAKSYHTKYVFLLKSVIFD